MLIVKIHLWLPIPKEKMQDSKKNVVNLKISQLCLWYMWMRAGETEL